MPNRWSLLVPSLAAIGAASIASCSSTSSNPTPTQSFSWVADLPAACTGKTYFEASTALCASGVTYLLCEGSVYGQSSCSNPGSGWQLETASADPVATGSDSCGMTTGPDGGAAPHGTVYVEGNVGAPGENAILQFRYCSGALLETLVARYPTGGSGAFDLGDNGILDADQQVVVNASRTLLFAVNQGSDTIAVFHIAGDGALTPVAGSPFPSGGVAPASVGVSGNILVVANKASDGIRDLTLRVPSYTTFFIQTDGSLTPTGTTYPLPLLSSPTQVYIAPGGKLVFTTEETGVVRGLQLSSSGGLTLAPGSPLPLPDSLFANGQKPKPVWPAGMSSSPTGSILYTGIPNYGSIIALQYTAAGQLTLLSEEADPNAALPCWSVVSANGQRLYFANATSDNVSVWDTATDPTHPTLIQTFALAGGGNPWALSFDPTGTLLFVITPRQISQEVAENQGQLLHELSIDANGKLAEVTGSPVPIPVPPETNPLGVVVVADH